MRLYFNIFVVGSSPFSRKIAPLVRVQAVSRRYSRSSILKRDEAKTRSFSASGEAPSPAGGSALGLAASRSPRSHRYVTNVSVDADIAVHRCVGNISVYRLRRLTDVFKCFEMTHTQNPRDLGFRAELSFSGRRSGFLYQQPYSCVGRETEFMSLIAFGLFA